MLWILPFTPRWGSYLAISHNLAYTARDDIALSILSASVRGTRAQATLCKSSPKLTSIGTTGQGGVGINDCITARDKVWVAWLPVFFLMSV